MGVIGVYFNDYVAPCRACPSDSVIARYVTFTKLPPYEGSQNPSVLLVGHSPKVRSSSRISMTLDLNEDRQLRRYVVGEVLEPLGIDLECCMASNIVKCLTTQMPEDICIVHGSFMERAFVTCQRHLIQEIAAARARLVISFSEKVANLLQASFDPYKRPRSMKEIFGTLRTLEIEERPVHWIPVVHIPKARVREHYFPEQTIRLRALGPQVERILSRSAGQG